MQILRPVRSVILALVALWAALSPALAAQYRVSSAVDIDDVEGKLRPGDSVVMANGVWTNQAIYFHGNGTPEKPITLRAQTPGKVVLTGKSSLIIDGQYVTASGMFIRDGGDATDGIAVKGRHCRLTESAMIGGTYKFFIHLFGSDNRVDHCYVAGKTSAEPTFQVEVLDQPNHHRIDLNHFGHRAPLGRNGGETMRVGYSWQSMSNSCTTVESNLFDRCDGEIEIISSKSCGNVYRYNTFLDCAGMLTLRHGNGCLVEGNFFLGHHKRGAGGIRVIGEDHTIINNYFDAVDQGGFWITSGISNSPLKGYFQARNCLIAFNTVVDCRGPVLILDAGLGTSGRTLRPYNITLADNLFVVPEGGTLSRGTESETYNWVGNMVTLSSALPQHHGIKVVEPELRRDDDGVWRPSLLSPVRNSAQGVFPAVKTDIDGQKRSGGFDVGCDEFSHDPVVNRPLTAGDVGPHWLDRSSSTDQVLMSKRRSNP